MMTSQSLQEVEPVSHKLAQSTSVKEFASNDVDQSKDFISKDFVVPRYSFRAQEPPIDNNKSPPNNQKRDDSAVK